MVPRPNLSGNSIYTFRLVHPRPMRISHKKTTLLQALTPIYITTKMDYIINKLQIIILCIMNLLQIRRK